MKKRGITLLLVVLMSLSLLAACGADKKTKTVNGKDTDSDDGPVDVVVEEGQTKRLASVTVEAKQGIQRRNMEMKFEYDEKGIVSCEKDADYREVILFDGSISRPTEYTYYNEDGTQSGAESFVYDTEGQLIQKTADQGMTVYEYTYDADGRLAASTLKTYYNGEEIFKTTYSYEFDENGQMIRSIQTPDSEDELGWIHTYNAEGQLIEKVNTYHGSTGDRWTYAYDGDGNLIKEDTPDEDTEYQYNQFGQMVKKDQSGSITEYRYDDNGLLIEEIETYDGEVDASTTYRYDAMGDLVEMIAEAGSYKVTATFQYEAADDFTFDNETLSDYVQYVKEEIYGGF